MTKENGIGPQQQNQRQQKQQRTRVRTAGARHCLRQQNHVAATTVVALPLQPLQHTHQTRKQYSYHRGNGFPNRCATKVQGHCIRLGLSVLLEQRRPLVFQLSAGLSLSFHTARKLDQVLRQLRQQKAVVLALRLAQAKLLQQMWKAEGKAHRAALRTDSPTARRDRPHPRPRCRLKACPPGTHTSPEVAINKTGGMRQMHDENEPRTSSSPSCSSPSTLVTDSAESLHMRRT
jgi:hypothetical protein